MTEPEWEKALEWLRGGFHTPTAAEAAALVKYFTEHPEQLTAANEWRNLPLHCAASHHGEHAVAIVAFLLKAHRDAVMHKNSYGWLPLHCAAMGQKGGHGAAVVTLLLKACPESGMQMNDSGNLPADCAEKFNTANLPASCKAMLRAAAQGKWTPSPSTIHSYCCG